MPSFTHDLSMDESTQILTVNIHDTEFEYFSNFNSFLNDLHLDIKRELRQSISDEVGVEIVTIHDCNTPATKLRVTFNEILVEQTLATYMSKYKNSDYPSFIIAKNRIEIDLLQWRPLPDYGDLFTNKEFSEMVICGSITPYDGVGHIADGNRMSILEVSPWNIQEYFWGTHVLWFNK